MSKSDSKRCPWPGTDPLYVAYHDDEWGVPERDDRALYEKLVLDGFQAGLSWITILRKREAFRSAFDDFVPEKVARYTKKRVETLMKDEGIVRNRMKIEGAIASAEVPAEMELSRTISKELKSRGFKFCGPTIVYAFMQATGMVNDHLTSCPRHAACARLGRTPLNP
jgi:DNA-3-methyladenine glycosylase I